MRAYSVFSRNLGPHEAAVLVFANSAKEARKLAWPKVQYDIVTEWTDLGVKWMRNEKSVWPLGDQDLLASNTPHVVLGPICCESCGLWGCGIDNSGMCGCCGEQVGELLKARFAKYETGQQ